MVISDSSQTRFAYMDALRGWAILAVIAGHASVMTQLTGPYKVIADGGLMGVYLFFVVSAFTIFHMLSRHAREEAHPVRNFFIRRLFRIIPVYWFGIILYIIIWGLLPQSQWWHYPIHFLLANVLLPETQSSAVPGGWSISVEVLFYLSVPLWFKCIKGTRPAWLLMLASVFLLPLVTFGLQNISTPFFRGIHAYWVGVFWERFPTNILGSFSFGILLFYLQKEGRVAKLFQKKYEAAAVIIMCLIALGGLGMFPYVYPIKAHFYGFFFMILALALAFYPMILLVNPLTVFIGRISYSMYLFHFAVLTWWTRWVFAKIPSWSQEQPGFFFLTFFMVSAATIPLAWCGYQIIERPAIALSKRIIARLEIQKSTGHS